MRRPPPRMYTGPFQIFGMGYNVDIIMHFHVAIQLHHPSLDFNASGVTQTREISNKFQSDSRYEFAFAKSKLQHDNNDQLRTN